VWRTDGCVSPASASSTWFPIKLGGADVTLTRLRPVLRGMMLTGGEPLYLGDDIGDRDATSVADPGARGPLSGKISTRYLAPYLARLDSQLT
jgi:hypothetical protein